MAHSIARICDGFGVGVVDTVLGQRHVIRILVVEEAPTTRSGLCDCLGQDRRMELVGRAAPGSAALGLVAEHRPHVLLLGLHGDSRRELELAEQVHAAFSKVRLLALGDDAMGGWLLPRLGIYIGGTYVAEVINAAIGAIIVLFVVGLLKRA